MACPEVETHLKGGRVICFRTVWLYLICLGALIGSRAELSAQDQEYREWRDTTLIPERVPNGIAFDEFPVGAYQYHYNFSRPITELWPYYSALNVDFVVLNILRSFDAKYGFDHQLRYRRFLDMAPEGKRAVLNISYSPSLITEASSAREVMFYPFDSSQMRLMGEHEHLFTRYLADSTRFNSDPANFPEEGEGPRESVYLPSDSGAVIAAGIVYNREPGRTHRFASYRADGTWNMRSGDSLIDADAFLHDPPASSALYQIVVKGHLFSPLRPGGADSDSLLRINVIYEVPRGRRYRDSSGTFVIAGANLRLPYTTLWVRRDDLKPLPGHDPDVYRTVALPLRLDQCEICALPGPLYPGNESRRLDLEVQWVGREPAAIRSIALRDSVAALLMGSDSLAIAYSQALSREIRELVADPFTGNLHENVFGVYTADEFPATQYAGLRVVEKMLKTEYVRDAGDSLNSWTTLLIPYGQHLADVDWLGREAYFNPHLPLPEYNKLYRVKYAMVPSVRQHNGGRWGIPEFFDLDELGDEEYDASMPGRIADMEETWQRVFLGAHTPFPQSWPYRVSHVNNMAADARRGRRLGRRVATLIGPNSQLTINFDEESGQRDTIANHRFERSEVRCLTNLALAYGSKSIVWYEQNGYPWMKKAVDGGPAGNIPVMGFGGLTTADTVHNVYDWVLRRPGQEDSIGLVQNYFLGFADAYREIGDIGRWLHRVGPRLATLRWRDGYSAHWRMRRPGNMIDTGRRPRPFPSDEIVTDVRARHPVSGTVDSVWNTYVELGLFETTVGTVNGLREPLRDTNHIFVVNRRTFEPYSRIDVDYSDAAERLIDSLAENRTITLQLNLVPPLIEGRPALVRVREVEPDTARLPYIGQRSVLDTTVSFADGPTDVEITLGPGRAALLELVFLPDDESFRSFLWPGRRRDE